eukprot:3936702-Rhodomonas_salina.1
MGSGVHTHTASVVMILLVLPQQNTFWRQRQNPANVSQLRANQSTRFCAGPKARVSSRWYCARASLCMARSSGVAGGSCSPRPSAAWWVAYVSIVSTRRARARVLNRLRIQSSHSVSDCCRTPVCPMATRAFHMCFSLTSADWYAAVPSMRPEKQPTL